MLNILKIHTTVLQLMKYLYQLVQITKFFILKTLSKANGHYIVKKVLGFIKLLKKKILINTKLNILKNLIMQSVLKNLQQMNYKNIKKLPKKEKLKQKHLMNKLMIQQIELQSIHIVLLKQIQEHKFIKTLKHIQVKAKTMPNLLIMKQSVILKILNSVKIYLKNDIQQIYI